MKIKFLIDGTVAGEGMYSSTERVGFVVVILCHDCGEYRFGQRITVDESEIVSFHLGSTVFTPVNS